jgi:hypothetical protein
MSNPGDSPPNPEFTDSDRAWFDALTGKPTLAGKEAAAREGHALRAALEQRRIEVAASPELDAATSDAAMREQLQRLRERVRAEGVFDTAVEERTARPTGSPLAPPRDNVIEFPWWRRRKVIVGLAASLLMAALLVRQIGDQADYPSPNEMLGRDGLQQLQAPQPKQSAEQFAERLRVAGLRPGLYQRGKTYIVDITLLASELPVAGPAFASLGLKPAAGFNRVEISPP